MPLSVRHVSESEETEQLSKQQAADNQQKELNEDARRESQMASTTKKTHTRSEPNNQSTSLL
jgi:hypothetical protein